jgi:hypothetical protein
MIINGTDYGEGYSLSLKEHKELHRGLKRFLGIAPEEVEQALEDEYYLATGKKKPVKKLKEDGDS